MNFKEIKNAIKKYFAVDTDVSGEKGHLFSFLGVGFTRLIQIPFLRNVSIVAIGPMVSQTLSILLSPIITRLYDPEAFGALGVFLSVLSILVPISNLSYTYAIIMPKKDAEGLKILRFSVLFGFIVSLITFVIVMFFRQPIAQLLNFENFGIYLYFIPLTLFFSTSAIAYDQWIIRKKMFKASSAIIVAQSILSNGSLIGLGFLAPQYASLIGVNIFTRGFHALASFIVAKKIVHKTQQQMEASEPSQTQKTLNLLKDYQDFPFYRTPQILVSTLAYNLPIMLMTIFSGPATVGLYSLAHRVLKLPSIIISESVGKVFQQRVTEAAQQGGSLQPLILKTTLLLAVIGIIPLGLIILFGPFLFSFVFGSEWVQAGTFARWVAIWVLMTFSSVPVVMAIPLLKLQKQYLIYELISLVLGAVGLVIGFIVIKNVILAAALFSCISAILSAVWMIFVIIKSKNRNRYLIVVEEDDL
jgi:O-antigen/teichoic acid export membrane protein